MWNGLVGVVKKAYSASLGEGVVPRPLMMPLVRGELVGLRDKWPLSTLVGSCARQVAHGSEQAPG